jgi:hypothetical protein
MLAGELAAWRFQAEYRPESPRSGNPILDPRMGSAGAQVR